MQPWQPILEDDEATAVANVVGEIADALVPYVDDGTQIGPGISGGAAGLALFFGYLAQAGHREDGWELAERLLERCIDDVATRDLRPALHGGFVGVAWALHHLMRLQGDEEDAVGDIDDALIAVLEAGPWGWDYDLISGLVGFAIYGLERLPIAGGRRVLELVASQLHDGHEATPVGATWFTPPELLPPQQRETYPNGYYNLGLAHGVPGVLGVLGPMVAAGIKVELTHPLLEDSVGWLLAQPAPAEASRFGYYHDSTDATRHAWCYGDPGAAIALWNAAVAVDHDEWKREAVEIARACAARTEGHGVRDAGICHGSVGLAAMWMRFYQATGDAEFRDAAVRWIKHTLEHRRADGVAGFPSQDLSSGELVWTDDPGLLTGSAGVGLVLLSAITDLAPGWDRSLLMSVRVN